MTTLTHRKTNWDILLESAIRDYEAGKELVFVKAKKKKTAEQFLSTLSRYEDPNARLVEHSVHLVSRIIAPEDRLSPSDSAKLRKFMEEGPR